MRARGAVATQAGCESVGHKTWLHVCLVVFKRTGEDIHTLHSTDFYQQEEGEETGPPSETDMKLFVINHLSQPGDMAIEEPSRPEEGGEHPEL